MAIRDLCRTDVVTCGAQETAFAAAQAMAARNVGSVIVVDDARRPLAVITDRDLVVLVVADSRDAHKTHLHEIMDRAAVTVDEDAGFGEVLEMMATRRVRRMPVVKPDGSLRGIVTLDDLIRLIGTEMQQVQLLISAESDPAPRH